MCGQARSLDLTHPTPPPAQHCTLVRVSVSTVQAITNVISLRLRLQSRKAQSTSDKVKGGWETSGTPEREERSTQSPITTPLHEYEQQSDQRLHCLSSHRGPQPPSAPDGLQPWPSGWNVSDRFLSVSYTHLTLPTKA